MVITFPLSGDVGWITNYLFTLGGGGDDVSNTIGMVLQYVSQIILFFKALALWADAFYKPKCPCVRVSVCP